MHRGREGAKMGAKGWGEEVQRVGRRVQRAGEEGAKGLPTVMMV